MKTVNSLFKKSKTLFFVLCALSAVTLISSCSDDNNDDMQLAANLMIVNSAEGSAAQDFYLDDAKVNSQALAYTQSSGYASVNSGNRKAEFRTTGSTTVNSSSNINFEGGKYYTVYYTGGTSSSANYTTEDDRTPPSSGKSKVRFVHLTSAVNSSVDVAVQGGSKIVSGLAYKAASTYSEVDAASSFQVMAAGSSSVLLNLTALNFQAGKIYTVYISGATALTVTYRVVANN